MNTETIFRILFLVLLVGVVMMRIYYVMRVRHPIYTARLGYGASLALVTANRVFIGLAVLVIAGLIDRVPKEERMMIEQFGEEYNAYMHRTGRFFPR